EKMLVMKPEKDPIVQKTLLEVIRQVKSPELRKQLAAKLVNPQTQTQIGQLYRKNIRLKDDPTYDHEVTTVKKISLASENWKIWFDKDNTGVRSKIFLPGFDDRTWKKIAVDKSWEAQGNDDYDGFAWYRVSFKAPPKNDYAGAEFYFPLVDEEAWIWLNGTYLGQRAEGPEAWSKPFFVDASKEILWGEINQLTVRVFDSAKAGGICKEPQLHLLKQE
ncbi:MAG: beta galactosidase jelly roll domain-containing protein, partial [Lentisphaeria bacterium]|nr:beta galactosidase jelly roll domain-containing protein [Lentisphaeria bacterium]